MPWHRSDDRFPEHPKCDALAEHFGDDWATLHLAFALWHHMGCDCAARRTDGIFNAQRSYRIMRAPREVVDLALAGLAKVGLLDKHRDGFVFHDWAEYQPTRAELDAERSAKTERQRRWRENLPKKPPVVDGGVDASTGRHVDGGVDASVDAPVDGAPSRPVPARPGETTSLSSPPVVPPSGVVAGDAPPAETPARAAKGKRAKPAPTPDTIPLPGTLARRVFDAIVADRALAPITVNPGDASQRWADPDAFPGVDVLAQVKRAGEYAAERPGKYSDGRAFIRGWLQRKADEVARAPKPAGAAAAPRPAVVDATRDPSRYSRDRDEMPDLPPELLAKMKGLR
jgi:hypothetical protein